MTTCGQEEIYPHFFHHFKAASFFALEMSLVKRISSGQVQNMMYGSARK